MFNPRTLVDAYTLARIQEANGLNNIKSNRVLWVPNHYRSNNQGGSAEIAVGFNRNSGFVGNKSQLQGNQRVFQNSPMGVAQNRGGSLSSEKALIPVQKIFQAQMEERRRKGLCYSCDFKWSRGHVCAAPKLFMIEELEVEGEVPLPQQYLEEDGP